jgi:hypothetical protein
MGQRTSVYLDDSLQAAEKASGVPIAELVRRGLGAGSGETAQPTTPGPVGPSLVALPDGEPSHGAICMTPACWQRDTGKYGLRSLPLCPA